MASIEEHKSIEAKLKELQNSKKSTKKVVIILCIAMVPLAILFIALIIALIQDKVQHETLHFIGTVVTGVFLFGFGWNVLHYPKDLSDMNNEIEQLEKALEKEAARKKEIEAAEKKSKSCPNCGRYPFAISEKEDIVEQISRMAEVVYKKRLSNYPFSVADEMRWNGQDIINVQVVPQGGKLIKITETKKCPDCGWETSTTRLEERWDGPSQIEKMMGSGF